MPDAAHGCCLRNHLCVISPLTNWADVTVVPNDTHASHQSMASGTHRTARTLPRLAHVAPAVLIGPVRHNDTCATRSRGSVTAPAQVFLRGTSSCAVPALFPGSVKLERAGTHINTLDVRFRGTLHGWKGNLTSLKLSVKSRPGRPGSRPPGVDSRLLHVKLAQQ